LKQGNVLSPWLLKLFLEYTTGKAEENIERLELYGAHHLLLNADDVILLGGNISVIEKNRNFII
jgi:hypothetical protein